MMTKVPQVSINRLTLYLRVLTELAKEDPGATISSKDLAEELGINHHQVRKDLSYFGKFGHRGMGYRVNDLIKEITNILGLDRIWNVCLCGLGNLGSALLAYKGFKQQGLNIVAIFDNDPKKIKKRFKEVKVYSPNKISQVVKEKDIRIGIIAVPQTAAQSLADRLISAGITAILNFAPTKLSIPQEKVKLRNVDLSVELINLTHFLKDLQKRSKILDKPNMLC